MKDKNTAYCRLYIVRHGQSQSNAGGYIGGGDTDITELGVGQVKRRAKKLKGVRFDAIFSSDYLRAEQTAKILAKEHRLAVITKQALRERSWGSVERKKTEELKEEVKKLFETFRTLSEKEKWSFKGVDNMESAEEAVSRFITILREIAVAYAGKTVLVVSHGTLMRSLLIHLGWATFEELPSRSVENTGYIVVDSDGVDFFVKETFGVNKKVK